MAVSVNCGVLFVGVLMIRALRFRVYIRAPDFGQLSYTQPSFQEAERSCGWERHKAHIPTLALQRQYGAVIPILGSGAERLNSSLQKRLQPRPLGGSKK